MESCHASHGSNASGQVSAFHNVRSGTGMSSTVPSTCARRCSSAVALGGSRLFIDATAGDGDAGAVGRLGAVDDDVGGGRGELDALHAGGMQHAVEAAHGDVA